MVQLGDDITFTKPINILVIGKKELDSEKQVEILIEVNLQGAVSIIQLNQSLIEAA